MWISQAKREMFKDFPFLVPSSKMQCYKNIPLYNISAQQNFNKARQTHCIIIAHAVKKNLGGCHMLVYFQMSNWIILVFLRIIGDTLLRSVNCLYPHIWGAMQRLFFSMYVHYSSFTWSIFSTNRMDQFPVLRIL